MHRFLLYLCLLLLALGALAAPSTIRLGKREADPHHKRWKYRGHRPPYYGGGHGGGGHGGGSFSQAYSQSFSGPFGSYSNAGSFSSGGFGK